MDWVVALNNAIEYIEDNLLGDITSSKIARHVYISSSHLQRGFYCLTGMTISEYVRNRRLSLAGHELATENSKVIDIALKYGYETPESFSKAFTRFHGATPTQAKRKGVNIKSYNRLTVKIIMEGGSVMDYRIEKKEEFDVIVKAKIFGEDSTAAIPAFWDEYFSQNLGSIVPPDLGVCGEVKAGGKEFSYGIGCFVEKLSGSASGIPGNKAGSIPDSFEKWTVPANTWAVFKCIGAMPDAIQSMWKRIYNEWLPQAKYEIASSYDFEYYTEGDNSSPDYISEIWIPVNEKK